MTYEAWIKIMHSTPGKPELDDIAGILGVPIEHALGAFVQILIHADQQIADAAGPGVTKRAIDREARVAGYADALEAVGWLVPLGDKWILRNYELHCGSTAKGRALSAGRSADYRARNDPTVTKSAQGLISSSLSRNKPTRRKAKRRLVAAGEADPVADQARRVVDLYARHVKPTGDPSRSRARRHVEKLLAGGADVADLARSVRNVATFYRGQEVATTYRRHVGNFFGQARDYADFLPGQFRPQVVKGKPGPPGPATTNSPVRPPRFGRYAVKCTEHGDELTVGREMRIVYDGDKPAQSDGEQRRDAQAAAERRARVEGGVWIVIEAEGEAAHGKG